MSIIPLQKPHSRKSDVIKTNVRTKLVPSAARNKPPLVTRELIGLVGSLVAVFMSGPQKPIFSLTAMGSHSKSTVRVQLSQVAESSLLSDQPETWHSREDELQHESLPA